MKIYTRTGDEGMTSLFGGDRIAKTHPLVEAYGTVDETSAAIGLARALLNDAPGTAPLAGLLDRLQAELFVLGGDLATLENVKYPVPRIEPAHTRALEREIDRFDGEIPPLKHFILPGGTPAAAALHVARTVCRRAERSVIEAGRATPVNAEAVPYLNRLSDLLFVLARWTNRQAGVEETEWIPVQR